jgi:hypothetical protein
MLNAIINSLKICEIVSYTKKLIQFVGCIVATMKTAKGKDKVKTTKEALKPVDDRLIPLSLGNLNINNEKLWLLRKVYLLAKSAFKVALQI